MTFKHRSSDLYEFHQTTDLNTSLPPATHSSLNSAVNSTAISQCHGTVTGRALGPHVDISGQRYQQGDFLCHDDRLGEASHRLDPLLGRSRRTNAWRQIIRDAVG